MKNKELLTAKNMDRRQFLKMATVLGGMAGVGIAATAAFGTGGGAAGTGGGGGSVGADYGWCSFWHDDQDPNYGSTTNNGPSPQGWDDTSMNRQLERLSKMVSLDYGHGGMQPYDSSSSMGGNYYAPNNNFRPIYESQARLALQRARDRATQQRGMTISHARVIGIGIFYMIVSKGTDPWGYSMDGMGTASFTELFSKSEMWPAAMRNSSGGIATGLRQELGWGNQSDIYGYANAGTNRDGVWERSKDDLPGTYGLIVIAVAEGEPINNGYLNMKKHPSM